MKESLMQQADTVMAATYARFPLVFTSGRGTRLETIDGKSYIDFVAGIAVCNLGHAHPAVTEALSKQAEQLVHVSNLYYTVPQVALAAWLTERSFADRVFFCNSGAEANEAAIKLARKYFAEKGTPRHRIVAMEQSFHGRTMATLSATGQPKVRAGYEPILEKFDFVPFNDVDALKSAVTDDTCAVMLEPVQGEGGVRCPADGYLKAVREICDAVGALLIYDEIQTGIGRTGKLFAYQHSGVAPDIMTLAKALGNGLPIGAMLATDRIAVGFSPGAHASTFGGTPLVTAAALAVVQTLEEDGLVVRAAEIGRYFKAQLLQFMGRHHQVEDVRGDGLLLGMRLSIPGSGIVEACMEAGFLINCIQEKVLRFIPPLVIEKSEIDALIACLDNILDTI